MIAHIMHTRQDRYFGKEIFEVSSFRSTAHMASSAMLSEICLYMILRLVQHILQSPLRTVYFYLPG